MHIQLRYVLESVDFFRSSLGGFDGRYELHISVLFARPGSRSREWNGRKRHLGWIGSCLLSDFPPHVPVLSDPLEHGTRLHRVSELRNVPVFYSLSVCPFEHCGWLFRFLWPLLYRGCALNQR
jgi:hypothetical protein